LGFHAGCNGHSAEVSFDANVLVVGGFGSTLIGCEAALQDQDSWLSDFFSSSPTVTIDWDRVTFSSGDVTLVFLDDEVANPAPPLIGTTWEVTTFIDGDIAFGGAFENPPTVTFQSDGRVVVFTGCNSGSGNYEYDNSSINFSDIGYTEAACTDMADVEQHLQMVFTQGEVSYRFDSLQLVIDRGTLGIRATEFE
jgi:heat shock protein HslJ